MKFAQKVLIKKQLDAILANNLHVVTFLETIQKEHSLTEDQQKTADLSIAHLHRLNDNLLKLVK